MNRALVFFLALLLFFCGAGILWFAAREPPVAGTLTEKDDDYVAPEVELTEFEFRDQLNKPFGSRDLEGKVWMGSFFFAQCPTICRQQNGEIAKIHRRFVDDDVMIVNISVAPEDDTPVVLLQYANTYEADHNRWKFLTGKSIKYVRQVGLDIFSLPAADETHTTAVAVFDRQGEMHGAYKVTDPQEFTKLVMKVEELLAQETPEIAAAKQTEEVAATEASQEP